MRIDKSLSWLEPFIDIAKKTEPMISKIVRIKNCVPQKDRTIQCAAQITHNEKEDTYSISIYTKYRFIKRLKPKPEFVILPYSKLDVLSCLAHEISHLKYWQHTPHRQKLENKLSSIFMDKLIEDGYVSEEDELAGRSGRQKDMKVVRK